MKSEKITSKLIPKKHKSIDLSLGSGINKSWCHIRERWESRMALWRVDLKIHFRQFKFERVIRSRQPKIKIKGLDLKMSHDCFFIEI